QRALLVRIMNCRNGWHEKCRGNAVAPQQFANARNALPRAELPLGKCGNRFAAIPQFERVMVRVKRQANRTSCTVCPRRRLEASSGTCSVHDGLKSLFRPGPCRNRRIGRHVVGPPLTDNVWPVIQLANGEARKSTAFEISSGSPIRRSGISLIMAACPSSP